MSRVPVVGYRRDVLIRLRLYDLPVQRILELVLIEAREPGASSAIESRVDEHDERLFRVSTRDGFSKTFARLYDVRDLLDNLFPNWADDIGDASNPVGRQERVDALRNLVQNNIAVESWRDYGGAAGSIVTIPGAFLIIQTPENHQQIEVLLYNLRKLAAARSRGEKPTTRGVDLLSPPTPEPAKK